MKTIINCLGKYMMDEGKIKLFVISFLSIFFSICTLLGNCYEKYGTWNSFFRLSSVLQLLGFIIIYSIVCIMFFTIMDVCSTQYKSKPVGNKEMFAVTGIILLCWLPYLICFYPGSVQTDASHQILETLGMRTLVDHHPVFSSLLIGQCVKIGIYFGNINLGVFLYTLLQSLVSAICYAYMITTLYRYKAPVSLCATSLFYFAIIPFWGGYAQTIVKDTLFTAITILFIIAFFEIMHNWEEFVSSRKKMIIFTLLMFFMALLRKNGIYTAVITLGALLATGHKYWRKILFMIFILLFLFIGYNKIILPAMGAESGSIREALSVPFQQTARYLKEYPEDVTREEREIIGKILSVDELANLYKPNISDPVKNTYIEEASKQDMVNYFVVWWKLLWRHPDAYMQATINNTYGYFYPNASVMGGYGTFSMELDNELENLGVSYGNSDMTFAREILIKIVYKLGNMPIVHWLYSAGIYTWILFLTAGYIIINRQYRKLIILVPSFTILLTCMLSPVNNYMRYALPMMAATPIVIFNAICREERE